MSSNSGRNTIITGVNVWGSGPVLSDLRVSGNTILNTLQVIGAAIFNGIVTFSAVIFNSNVSVSGSTILNTLQVLGTAIFNGVVTFFSNVIFKSNVSFESNASFASNVSFTTLPTSLQLTPTQQNQLVTKNYMESVIISGELDIFDNNNTWTNTNTWEDNSYFNGEVKWTKSCIFDLDVDEIIQIGKVTKPVANFLATTTSFTVAASTAATITGGLIDMNGAVVDIVGGGYTFPYPVLPAGGYFKIQPLATTVKAMRSLYLEGNYIYGIGTTEIQMNAPSITVGGSLSETDILGGTTKVNGQISTIVSSGGKLDLRGVSEATMKVTSISADGNNITMIPTKITIDANTTDLEMKAFTINQIAPNHRRGNNVLGTGIITDTGNQIVLNAQLGTAGPGIIRLNSPNNIYIGNSTGTTTPDPTDSVVCSATAVKLTGITTADIAAPDVDITATTSITEKAPKIDINGTVTLDLEAPAVKLNGVTKADINGADIDITAGTSVTIKAPTVRLQSLGTDNLILNGARGRWKGLDFTFEFF